MTGLRIDPQSSAVQKQVGNAECCYQRQRRDDYGLQSKLPIFENGRIPKGTARQAWPSNAAESEVAGRMFCEGFTAQLWGCDGRNVGSRIAKRAARGAKALRQKPEILAKTAL